MSKRNKTAQKAARARLRNAIRNVIYNRMWLADAEEQKFTLNVKKNISMLIRTQQKIGLLTMADKSLIRTHHSIRTVEERKRLVHLIANLTCFSKLSPKLRARLVPVISFLYVGPGREIIKEGDPPRYVYFILTGEVEVMEKIWNPVSLMFVEEIISVIGPGDCIGDIEFIEQCLRRNTYTTRNNCELLVVFEDDFDRILRDEMTKLWMEKKAAFQALPYFNNLSASQLQRGCKLAQLRQYEPLETIYFEDKGHASPVYFIVSGECMILQCLKLKVRELNGKKTFELVDISHEEQEGLFQPTDKKQETKDDDDFDIEEELKSLVEIKSDHGISSGSNTEVVEELTEKKPKRVIQMKTLQEIERDCLRWDTDIPYDQMEELFGDDDDGDPDNIKKPVTAVMPIKADEITQQVQETDTNKQIDPESGEVTTKDENVKDGDIVEGEIKDGEIIKEEENEKDIREGDAKVDANNEAGVTEVKVNEVDHKIVDDNAVDDTETKGNEEDMNEQPKEQVDQVSHQDLNENKSEIEAKVIDGKEMDLPEDENLKDIEKIAKNEAETDSSIMKTHKLKLIKRKSWKQKKGLEIRYESRFIDVGSLLFGGIFGLGEKLQHRVIMARSTVQCLLVPRYWLFEPNQNPGNIWQRRRFYLNTSIPSRENLFLDFLREKEWRKFKNEVVNKVLETATSGNPTKIQDIPIICRIVEGRHDD